jgi:limonene-1,2-epoxide hydrolase
MSDPVTVVTEFLSTLSRGREGFAEAVRRWFTPASVWENVGLATTTGPDEALALLNGMGLGGLRIEILSIAATGRTVLTERVDYLLGPDGETRIELRCMGAFEVDADGRITRWTDYFDASPFRTAG